MIKPIYKQIYASLGIIFLSFSNGYICAIVFSVAPSLRNSSMQLTDDQESWLPSASVVMMLPSQFLSGILTNTCGRKYILLASLLPPGSACILFYLAQNFETFIIASALTGLVAGGIAIGPMFVAESCSPKLRAIILNLVTACFIIGLALAHFLSNFFHWRSLVLYDLIFVICGIITTATTPESPAWYASKGRFEECRNAFHWLRGNEDDAELLQLIDCRRKILDQRRIKQKRKNRKYDFIPDKSFIKAVAINFTTVLFIEACGKQIFIMFVYDILNIITGDENNVYYYALLFDITNILSTVMSCVIMRNFKRRTVVFWTGIPALFVLLVVCALLYLMSHTIVPTYPWVALFLFLLYFSILNMGAFQACMVVLGEIYPLEYRGIGVAISSCLYMGIFFIIVKITPSLLRSIGLHGTFFLNAVAISMSLLHFYFFLPETSKRTLQDIENEMKSNDFSDHKGLNLEAEENMLFADKYVK